MTAQINNAWLMMTGAETAANIYGTFANNYTIAQVTLLKISNITGIIRKITLYTLQSA